MSPKTPRVSLDRLVTNVAVDLMVSSAATSVKVARASSRTWSSTSASTSASCATTTTTSARTRLIAEWPVRPVIPDPDPLGLVYFADADPVFALCEHQKEARRLPPRTRDDDYQRTIEEAANVPADLDGVRPDAVGRYHHGRTWLRQIRRQGMDPRGTQRAQGDRIAVRAAAGPHRRPRTSCAFSPSMTT